MIDDLLRNNVTNSEVIKERIEAQGYRGSTTYVKAYIREHRDLVPPKRHIMQPKGNRSVRYSSTPSDSYQMDWGFVNIETGVDSGHQAA